MVQMPGVTEGDLNEAAQNAGKEKEKKKTSSLLTWDESKIDEVQLGRMKAALANGRISEADDPGIVSGAPDAVSSLALTRAVANMMITDGMSSADRKAIKLARLKYTGQTLGKVEGKTYWTAKSIKGKLHKNQKAPGLPPAAVVKVAKKADKAGRVAADAAVSSAVGYINPLGKPNKNRIGTPNTKDATGHLVVNELGQKAPKGRYWGRNGQLLDIATPHGESSAPVVDTATTPKLSAASTPATSTPGSGKPLRGGRGYAGGRRGTNVARSTAQPAPAPASGVLERAKALTATEQNATNDVLQATTGYKRPHAMPATEKAKPKPKPATRKDARNIAPASDLGGRPPRSGTGQTQDMSGVGATVGKAIAGVGAWLTGGIPMPSHLEGEGRKTTPGPATPTLSIPAPPMPKRLQGRGRKTTPGPQEPALTPTVKMPHTLQGSGRRTVPGPQEPSLTPSIKMPHALTGTGRKTMPGSNEGATLGDAARWLAREHKITRTATKPRKTGKTGGGR